MMTNLEQFELDPWKKGNLHSIYENSFLHIIPAPETATGEILLASLYRNVGFVNVGEKVWQYGTPFRNAVKKTNRPSGISSSSTSIDIPLWQNIVDCVIASPRLSGQRKQRGNQISPIVPDATLYSMSARLTGNPWNPGKLIARIIALGVESKDEALALWQALFDGLSVTNDQDEVWARLLQEEFESWRQKELCDAWQRPTEFPLKDQLLPEDFNLEFPAKAFVADLQTVLVLKNKLTRRQWITLLESLCRIGASAHVMWLCAANDWCYKAFEAALDTGQTINQCDVEKALSTSRAFWSLGQPSKKTITDTVRHYITGRCSLNLILLMIEQSSLDISQIDLSSPARITSTLNYLAINRASFDFESYRNKFSTAMEMDNRVADCKKGTSKNVLEFLEHVIRQRIPLESGLESYDQGYFLKKKGSNNNSPWIVALGPLSVFLMVHCATSRVLGPCTVQDLVRQLGFYGIEAAKQLGQGGTLNKLLRDMSIAVDSPDAEGGMVIRSPLAFNAE